MWSRPGPLLPTTPAGSRTSSGRRPGRRSPVNPFRDARRVLARRLSSMTALVGPSTEIETDQINPSCQASQERMAASDTGFESVTQLSSLSSDAPILPSFPALRTYPHAAPKSPIFCIFTEVRMIRLSGRKHLSGRRKAGGRRRFGGVDSRSRGRRGSVFKLGSRFPGWPMTVQSRMGSLGDPGQRVQPTGFDESGREGRWDS